MEGTSVPHPARPTVTLHDVAAAAGVSVATASRVLGGSSRTVAPEFEARVQAAATALRYTADASARAMRRPSDSIVLIVDDLTTPSIGMVVAAMERQTRAINAFVTVSSARGTPERQLETVRLLRALRPRALVLTSSRFEANALGGKLLNELTTYEGEGGRVVIVGSTDMPFDSIRFDDRGAGLTLGTHLAQTGHRGVAILAGPARRANLAARVAGLTEGLRAGGVDKSRVLVRHCDVSRQGGFEAARALLEEGLLATRLLGRDALPGTDALVGANDVVAIGAMTALRLGGVSVPSDISVAGIDDIQLAVDVTPRLTTIALPLEQVGADAIRLVLGERLEAGHLTVSGHLIVRDSTIVR
jgi:LacI family transcriptional regulator